MSFKTGSSLQRSHTSHGHLVHEVASGYAVALLHYNITLRCWWYVRSSIWNLQIRKLGPWTLTWNQFMSGEWVMQKLIPKSILLNLEFNSVLPGLFVFQFLNWFRNPGPIYWHDLESSLANRAFGSTSWPSTLFRRLSITLFELSFSKRLKDHHEGLPSDQFHQS